MCMKYLEVLFVFMKSPFWKLKDELFSWVTFPFEPAHVFSCLKLHWYLLCNEMYSEYVKVSWHYYFPNLSLFLRVWWWMCTLWVMRMLPTKSLTILTIPLWLWISMPLVLSPLHRLLAIISPAIPLEKLFARPTNTANTWTSGTIFTLGNQIFWTRRPCGQTNGTSNIIKLLFRCVPWKIPQCHNFWWKIFLFGTTAGPQNQQMAYWSACQIGHWHSGGSWLVDVLNSHTFRFSIMMLRNIYTPED